MKYYFHHRGAARTSLSSATVAALKSSEPSVVRGNHESGYQVYTLTRQRVYKGQRPFDLTAAERARLDSLAR